MAGVGGTAASIHRQPTAQKGVYEYALMNGSLAIKLLSYGATLTSVRSPDRDGKMDEVTLCYSTLEELQAKPGPYFGCIAGRVANRIAGGKFSVDYKSYSLALNNGPNALHGGLVGFDKKNWDSRAYLDDNCASVVFEYFSVDGEEGYPGSLTTTVTYTLEHALPNQLRIDYRATTEGAATPINLTNHTYWNLSGSCQRPITDHCLKLSCSRYLPVDSTQIPQGVEAPVDGTFFDFTGTHSEHGVVLGERISHIDGAGQPGLDHCFCVDKPIGESESNAEVAHIATLTEPQSGRRLSVYGTQPGVQVYSANWLSLDSKQHPFTQHNALCIETQDYPDAINQPQFPSCLLRPGQVYQHTALFVLDTV